MVLQVLDFAPNESFEPHKQRIIKKLDAHLRTLTEGQMHIAMDKFNEWYPNFDLSDLDTEEIHAHIKLRELASAFLKKVEELGKSADTDKLSEAFSYLYRFHIYTANKIQPDSEQDTNLTLRQEKEVYLIEGNIMNRGFQSEKNDKAKHMRALIQVCREILQLNPVDDGRRYKKYRLDYLATTCSYPWQNDLTKAREIREFLKKNKDISLPEALKAVAKVPRASRKLPTDVAEPETK